MQQNHKSKLTDREKMEKLVIISIKEYRYNQQKMGINDSKALPYIPEKYKYLIKNLT